jgi:hypothetical protein
VLAASIIGAIALQESTSETSVNVYQTTQSNNPEDSHLHHSTCFLSLIQNLYSDNGSNLIDLLLSNNADLSIKPAEYDIVQPGSCHPLSAPNCIMSIRRSDQSINFPFKGYSARVRRAIRRLVCL